MPSFFDEYKGKLLLAPMAGVTDKAFRTICLRHGAALTYTEMVSAKGLEYDNKNTWDLLEPADEEEKIAVQLFGHEPNVLAAQAHAVQQHLGSKLAFIDVNMGCPVKKVVSKDEGSALMKTPDEAAEIISSICKNVDVAVTAKFRSGWDSQSVNAVDFALRLQEAGAAAVAIHGRTSKQMYSGKADWSIIAQVKAACEIPVIGSGDIYSFDDAQKMMEQTGADAVMAARGARGNPWIFENKIPSKEERLACMREHLHLYVQFFGSEHLTPLRSQFAAYAHGISGAAQFRRALSQCTSYEDFEGLLND